MSNFQAAQRYPFWGAAIKQFFIFSKISSIDVCGNYYGISTNFKKLVYQVDNDK